MPNSTSIKGHVNEFLFDTRLVSFVGVDQLETALAGFTFVAGPPVRLITVSTKPFAPDGILVAAVGA